jgi:thiol-disulfide isomerase/thioredoxin
MVAGKKRTTRSSNARMGRVMPSIDVNDAKMVEELKKRIAKGPITLILVHAEWCGHCQTYKPKFAELENNKNRSIQIARVRDDIYPSLGIENGEIEGYPSVIAVSRENKALNFKGENGKRSNTIPDHNDMAMMNTIVEKGLPGSDVNAESGANVESEKMNSMNVSRPLNSQINENISNAIENMPPSVNGSAIPPDTSSDSIYENSQMANRTKNNNSLVYKPTYGQKQMTGGGNCGCGGLKSLTGGQSLTGGSSLYGLLTSVASEAATPALLLGAAAYLTKRKAKGSRKALKRKSRSTRRK